MMLKRQNKMAAVNVNSMERKQGAAKVIRVPEIIEKGKCSATSSNIQTKGILNSKGS